MITTTPLYISPIGGSITFFRGDSGRIFRSCAFSRCVYSGDLHSAKTYLDNLENDKSLSAARCTDSPAQRKMTLKWNVDGELFACSHDCSIRSILYFNDLVVRTVLIVSI